MKNQLKIEELRNVTIGAILSLVLFTGCNKELIFFPGTIQEEVDKAIDRGFDGIVVYVNQSGISSFYSAGWKNRENQVPADPHVLFKIASISKLYIAAATTKLIADQSLSLDHTLTKLLPDLAEGIEYSDQITLRMLLQHRSGIPDFIDAYPWDNPFKDNSETYTLVMGQPADFRPDKKHKYSNTNYWLIGEILDRTLGYSHHQYIQNEILHPLRLNNTHSLLSEVDIEDVMSGYNKGYEPDIKGNDFIQPGGSMVATAEDVGVFLRALIDGTLLTDDEQAIYSSVYQYEHTGWLPGYTSIARYHSDIDAVVIQFVNTSSNELFWLQLEQVYNRIVKALEKEQSNN
ncbi:MAG: serine hydrolase domain-containing protein [Imperialibacter sp.]|uniref:serine hydrolase domain-containing protein n=1 Tax=Imperialibacter sp. TaxID=2038411 RepID=UPI0032EB07C2